MTQSPPPPPPPRDESLVVVPVPSNDAEFTPEEDEEDVSDEEEAFVDPDLPVIEAFLRKLKDENEETARTAREQAATIDALTKAVAGRRQAPQDRDDTAGPTEVDIFDTATYATIEEALKKLKEANAPAVRVQRRLDTGITHLAKIFKSRRKRSSGGRITPLPPRKCVNCQRVNRSSKKCLPRAGKSCGYCKGHGIECEGPVVAPLLRRYFVE